MVVSRSVSKLPLRKTVTCPHCWQQFSPHEIKWVSADPGLLGDPRLGSDSMRRFLPSRFTVDGNAIDVNGGVCIEVACPKCHLAIPRVLLELPPLFVSVLGAPSSGKSYYLACVVWKRRQTLSEYFHLAFIDADPEANLVLSGYEETLFLNPQRDQPVALPKTEREGDLYQSVRYGEEHQVWYPRPFVFAIQPQDSHPYHQHASRLSRALCLYDNAGEHFMPGGEGRDSHATRHLAHSEALLFLFDPTQHPRFREACEDSSADPQIHEKKWTHPQHQVLAEAASRIRATAGLSHREKLDRPLVVVVTKHDAWCSLTGNRLIPTEAAIRPAGKIGNGLYKRQIESISSQTRRVLNEISPEIVAAAESLSSQVIYIPVSAFGQAPGTPESGQGPLVIRPCDIKSHFVEVPLLWALNQVVNGLIPSAVKKQYSEE